jgi:hypothetical protein
VILNPLSSTTNPLSPLVVWFWRLIQTSPIGVDSVATIGELGAALVVGELLPVHRVVEMGALRVEAVQMRLATL